MTGRQGAAPAGGRPAEVGQPTWAREQYRLVRSAPHLQRAGRRSGAQAVRLLAGLAGGIVATVAVSGAGPLFAVVTGVGFTVIVFVAILLPHGRGELPMANWDRWAAAWVHLQQAVREGLDGAYTICWDRRVAGWATPVTIVAGPAGLAVLAVAGPGERAESRELARIVSNAVAAPTAVTGYHGDAGTDLRWWRNVVWEIGQQPKLHNTVEVHDLVTTVTDRTGTEPGDRF